MWFRKKKKNTITISTEISKSEVLDGLKMVSNYFQIHIKDHALFEPEFEITKKINALLEDKVELSKADVLEIIMMMNSMDEDDHYNGTGWMDYQMRLMHYFRLHGYSPDYHYGKITLK